MKAIIIEAFGGPETMKLNEVQQPQPGKGEILIKVEAAGVNPVETYIRAGAYPILPKLPFTPGLDASGTIVELGQGVTGLKKGDRVYYAGRQGGTYAEFVVGPRERFHLLPEEISFSQGASIGVPSAAAWRALFHRGQAKAAETVLIHGASGAAGLTAVQLAFATGLEVLGTASTTKGRELVLKLGATAVFDHTESGYVEAIKTQTAGRGINLIIEMLANVNLEKDLDLLAPRGRVVIIGNRGRIEIDPRATMGKETDIRGMSLFNATIEEATQIHAGLIGAMKSGSFKPVVAAELPLEQAPKAHRMVMESGNCGNIVLLP
jgi:NADPH2:quinone reductase